MTVRGRSGFPDLSPGASTVHITLSVKSKTIIMGGSKSTFNFLTVNLEEVRPFGLVSGIPRFNPKLRHVIFL